MPKIDWQSWFSFRRMRVWQKCALIAAPFLLPIAGLLYLVVVQNNKDIGVAKAEVRGAEFLRPLKELNVLLGRHRSLAGRVASGDKSAQAELTKTAGQIDDAVAEADKAEARLGAEFKTGERRSWQKVKDEWAALKSRGGMTSPADSFAQHSAVIAQLQVLVSDVWEISNLILDPVADTYYLQDMMLANSILGSEEAAKLQAVFAAAAARSPDGKVTFTQQELIDVNVQLGKVQGTKENIEKETGRAVAYNPTALKGKMEGVQDAYSKAVDEFTAKVRGVIDGKPTTTAEAHASGAAVVTASSKLYDTFDPLLVELLDKRAGGYQQTNLLALVGTAVGLLAVFAVAVFVARSITKPINQLNDVFAKIGDGDYRQRAAVATQDELGQMARGLNVMLDNVLTLVQSKGEKEEIQQSIMKLLDEVSGVADGDLTKEAEVTADMTGAIADSFNYMIDQLRRIISNVQSATLQVSSAATQIHASAQHLAGGAENQAGQITGTSAAIDEMAASIQQVSEKVVTSTSVAQKALAAAKQGNDAVRNTIDGMTRIREQAQETSKRIKRLGETTQEIGQIVQLIDDIADRTSILALNASIQAAAAGEAGRGFAVVAEEVERLAVRSTEATKKISSLVRAVQGETTEAVAAMEKNIQEVVSGSKVAASAGQSLNEIEQVSLRLAELIESISLSARQQARGSEALSRSMGDINTITQQTAAGTKQTAESVDSLARLADELRESVSRFRLPAAYASAMPGDQSSGIGRLPSGVR
jgi:methyl-accepting chemotaxis protein